MPVFSHSRISSYENCPFQYKLRYIDNIRVVRDTIERFLGNTVHSTLEYLYQDVIKGNQRELEKVVELYNWFWNNNFKPGIVIVKKRFDAPHYKNIGEKCIIRYYNEHFPFNKNKILGLEQKLDIRLDEKGEYIMTGVIDRIDETKEGYIEIHDYKTGMRDPSPASIEKDRQLALYHVGAKDLYGHDKKIILFWHYLMSGNEYKIEKNDESLQKVKTEAIESIEIIESAKEFPMKTGPLCNYCDYFGVQCKPDHE